VTVVDNFNAMRWIWLFAHRAAAKLGWHPEIAFSESLRG